MMLRPEAMCRFIVVVPREHEDALINALVMLGAAHLREPEELREAEIPEELRRILEGKVTPEKMDPHEALEIIKRYSSNPERSAKAESLVKEYEELEKLMRIVRTLEELGLKPEAPRRRGLLRLELFVGPQEKAEEARAAALRKGAAAYAAKLDGDSLLVIAEVGWHRVDPAELRALGFAPLELPRWLLEARDAARELSRRLRAVREELFELLEEVAHSYEDALRREQAARRELYEGYLKTLEQLRAEGRRLLALLTKLRARRETTEKLRRALEGEAELARPPRDLPRALRRALWEMHKVETELGIIGKAERMLDQLRELEERERLLAKLEELGLDAKSVQGTRFIKFLVLKGPREKAEELRAWAAKRGVLAYLIEEGERAVAILALKREEQVKPEELRELGFAPLRLEEARELAEKAGELRRQLRELAAKCAELAERLAGVLQEAAKYEPAVRAYLQAKKIIAELRIVREHWVSIAEGWIPARYAELFEKVIRAHVPRIVHLSIHRPRPGEPAPTAVRYPGILKYLSALTWMRDVPNYWELDPTPFFVSLFVLMYGFMFGDVGLGALMAVLGAIIFWRRARLLGMTERGARTLGALMMCCGASAVVFGALYGVVFLKECWYGVISPLHDVWAIFRVALYFGAAQLLIAMALHVIDCLLVGDWEGALFSGRGIPGIVYYAAGIYVARQLVASGFSWGALLQGACKYAVLLMVAMMGVVLLGPVIGALHGGHGEVMEAVAEVMEMLIAYPANSLSYVRLAAFAIAHEIFGVLAETLAESAGALPSFLFANLLVFAIEGFAVGIQALRLLYYEYATKFYRGGGIPYRPLALAETHT